MHIIGWNKDSLHGQLHLENDMDFEGKPIIIKEPVAGTVNAQVVVILHGGFGTPQFIHDVIDQHLPETSLRVYPSADPVSKLWAVGGVFNTDPQENLYLSAVINHVLTNYDTAPENVYLIGHSLGATKAYDMLGKIQYPFAGMIALSGVPITAEVPNFNFNQAGPILHLHGAVDTVVKPAGTTNQDGVEVYPSLEQVRVLLDKPNQTYNQVILDGMGHKSEDLLADAPMVKALITDFLADPSIYINTKPI